MEVAWSLLRFVQGGISSNWYGLACPSHCGSPVFGSLLASYLFGFLSGLGFVALLAFFILGYQLPPATLQTSLARSLHPPGFARLAQYLHEHPSIRARDH